MIGIGAGPATDGQVLVFHDLLGIFGGHAARFVKRYAEVREQMVARRRRLRRARSATAPFPAPSTSTRSIPTSSRRSSATSTRRASQATRSSEGTGWRRRSRAPGRAPPPARRRRTAGAGPGRAPPAVPRWLEWVHISHKRHLGDGPRPRFGTGLAGAALRKLSGVSGRPHPEPVAGRQSSGLYDPAYEHDGCGVAAVARLDGVPIHDVVVRALKALDDLEHRGAAGADPTTGDGAGIMVGLPHDFLAARASEFGASSIPPPGRVALAMSFLPSDRARAAEIAATIERTVAEHGAEPLGWREVPVVSDAAGRTSSSVAPTCRQLLIGAGDSIADQDAFERRLFVIRRLIELEIGSELSLRRASRRAPWSSRGCCPRLSSPSFYPDLRDPELRSAPGRRPLALLDQHLPELGARPPVPLQRPQRRVQHAARATATWMRAREAALRRPARR